MKKIRLDLGELRVESFVTSKGSSREGTVFGMAFTDCEQTCDGYGTTCNLQEWWCDSGAPCANYTQAEAQSCTGTGPGTGTIPPPETYDATCGDTCDENPDSCNGVMCQPD